MRQKDTVLAVRKTTGVPVGIVGIVSTEIAGERTLVGIVTVRTRVGVLTTRLTMPTATAAMMTLMIPGPRGSQSRKSLLADADYDRLLSLLIP